VIARNYLYRSVTIGDVQAICAHTPASGQVLARTRAADVGLAPDTDVREIEYIEIADWPQYTVGIFLVPKGRKLPLHDHPGMTVLSKVLFGKMAITSFDKVDYGRDVQESDYHTPIETIVRSVLKDFTSDDGCNILHSTSGGNLHEFLAIGKFLAYVKRRVCDT